MNKQEFKMIINSKEFEEYLKECIKESSKLSERVWEKSIPLWIAAYFQKKKVQVHLFDGNYGCNLKQLEKKYGKNKKIEITKIILNVAGKQENSAHADFSIHGAKPNSFGMNAVGMLEIKSLYGWEKSPFRIKSIFQDICMCLVYNLFLEETGSAFMLFLNVPYKNTVPKNKNDVMEKLEKMFKEKFKNCDKAVQLAVKKIKWENLIIWMEK